MLSACIVESIMLYTYGFFLAFVHSNVLLPRHTAWITFANCFCMLYILDLDGAFHW